MPQIRLNAEGLSQASLNLRNYGNNLENLIGEIQNVINSLPDSWEGAAANAYVEQFAGLNQTRELVETIARQIEQTLAAAQELDSNIAGQFK